MIDANLIVPLPQLEGVHVRPAIPNTNRPSTPRSNPPPSASPNLQAASPGSDTLLPDERAHYISLFQSSGPVDGILIGKWIEGWIIQGIR